jgi:hypothetical protein
MRRPRWSIKTSKNWLLLAALPAIFLLGFVAFVFLRAQHSLERAGKAVAQQGRFPVELRNLDASNPDRRNSRLPNPGFEAIASPATYASGAFYQGKLYVSGPSGLFVYGADDTLLKTYRVGLDLPTAPLGAMVVGRLRGASEPELIVATAGEGILIFSGTFGDAEGKGTFRQIRPQDAEVRNVTALLALPTGELLIGTRHHGLLVYRGQDAVGTNYLETFHPQLASLSVTALAADASGVWVGTRNQGLRHWHAGQIDTFESARPVRCQTIRWTQSPCMRKRSMSAPRWAWRSSTMDSRPAYWPGISSHTHCSPTIRNSPSAQWMKDCGALH